MGIGLGLKMVAGVKNIEEKYEEGLNNQTCTGEVVDKTYTPEHEELSLIGRTPVLSKVPENRTITMQLGVGCRPYGAGDEIEINTEASCGIKQTMATRFTIPADLLIGIYMTILVFLWVICLLQRATSQ